MDTRQSAPSVWVRSEQGERRFTGRVVIGRETTCDVVVSDPRASRHHLTLQPDGDAWVAVDSSSGGTYVAGERARRHRLGTAETLLRLGGLDGESITVWLTRPPASTSTDPAAPVVPAAPATSIPHPEPGAPQPVVPPGQLAHGQTLVPAGRPRSSGGTLSIGRDLSNDIVLDDPLVSRFHGRLELATSRTAAVLHDGGSFNGIFVDGRRVLGSAPLRPGAEVVLGNQTFVWDGDQLLSTATRHEFTLYADGLSVVAKGGKRLIDNLSFQLDPSSLTAVIGPSGAGKSTLLGALTGLSPATQGRVVWQGHDLYAHYDQLRFQIGVVPQQDIQHPQLKVRQALGYAAELRLPPDTQPHERAARVHTVAAQLQLSERLDNRIGSQLSGGQRKRVSIATELLTAPPLLFLDEPTSGLDPGLDLEVMRQLRGLADGGRVVMVVTHSVLALDVCDAVMVLAPGGRIAYHGPPDGVLAHFGVDTYPQVFDLLDDPDLWSRIPPPAPPAETGLVPSVVTPVPAPRHQSRERQLSTLIRRNLAVVVADRLLLTMLVALPLVLGGLSRLVPGEHGLSLDAALAAGDGSQEVRQRLTVLVVAACLMGTALAIRELVGERPVFRREYAVGLSPGAYLASKIAVLGALAFLQGLLVTWIATAGLPGPDGFAGTTRLALVVGALSLVMVVVGLALSAVVTSTEQAMPALVGVIMVQLVLSGTLFAIAARPLLEQVAWLSPSRWAYAAAGSAIGIERPRANAEDADVDWIAQAGAAYFLLDLVMLALLLAGSSYLALLLVRRSATRAE
ncbi:ATP-binding cassette domain-containing protein [Nocardioides sp.]|uniref:ATP-binding cassette domain-containing protein n=1 Tax=Nocardioides sp. TaxID=35761 RepID=UPI0026136CC4|nr:ATP-binding cassette domain-containing protein [Nocardioides sp.]